MTLRTSQDTKAIDEQRRIDERIEMIHTKHREFVISYIEELSKFDYTDSELAERAARITRALDIVDGLK